MIIISSHAPARIHRTLAALYNDFVKLVFRDVISAIPFGHVLLSLWTVATSAAIGLAVGGMLRFTAPCSAV